MKKRLFAVFIIFVLILTFTSSVGAVTLNQYFNGISSVGLGNGNMLQTAYRSFFQMETFAFASGVPVFDLSEDEIRISNNYLPIGIPFTINNGNITTPNYDTSSINVGTHINSTTYQYSDYSYTSVSPYYVVTSINVADEYGNANNLKSATFNILNIDPNFPSTLYFRGSVYGRVVNGHTYSFSLNLPYSYKLYIKGGFSVYSNSGELERYAVTNKVISVNGRYNFDIQSVLGDSVYNQLATTHSLDEWVFSGAIIVSVDDTSVTQYPTLRVYYNTSKVFTDEATNFSFTGNTDSYSVYDDPIISFMVGRQTSAPEELLITQNGMYNIRTPTLVNVNVPQTLEWGNMFDWIFDSIGSFMTFEIAPGWSIGILMSIAVSLAVGIWLMRIFMGG